jgi:hypothetical protein
MNKYFLIGLPIVAFSLGFGSAYRYLTVQFNGEMAAQQLQASQAKAKALQEGTSKQLELDKQALAQTKQIEYRTKLVHAEVANVPESQEFMISRAWIEPILKQLEVTK